MKATFCANPVANVRIITVRSEDEERRVAPLFKNMTLHTLAVWSSSVCWIVRLSPVFRKSWSVRSRPQLTTSVSFTSRRVNAISCMSPLCALRAVMFLPVRSISRKVPFLSPETKKSSDSDALTTLSSFKPPSSASSVWSIVTCSLPLQVPSKSQKITVPWTDHVKKSASRSLGWCIVLTPSTELSWAGIRFPVSTVFLPSMFLAYSIPIMWLESTVTMWPRTDPTARISAIWLEPDSKCESGPIRETGRSEATPMLVTIFRESTQSFPIVPPIHRQRLILSTVIQRMLDPVFAIRSSPWFRPVSSSKQISPLSVHIIALQSDIATTQVKVASTRDPSKQFLPENVLGIGLPCAPSIWLSISKRFLEGEAGMVRSSLHTLTWRVPTVITLLPIHAMLCTKEVTLLLNCNLQEPDFGLIDHK